MIYRPNNKVTGAGNPGELFIRTVRSILNKLTPENFQKLTNEVTHIDLSSKSKLTLVINLIFEKAVDESKYCRLYALLCLRLNEEVPNFEQEECVFSSFQRILLKKLQYEFDTRRQGNVDPGSREKRQLLGLSAFIGELYSLSLIREVTVHACLKDLLKKEDPEALECLVTILETSGERLDHLKGTGLMDQYFIRIRKFSDVASLPARVRFRLLDVIDMRSRQWRQRRQIAGPRPVSEMRVEYGTSQDQTKLAPQPEQNTSKIQRDHDRKAKASCAFFQASRKPATNGHEDKKAVNGIKPVNSRNDSGRDESNFFITKTFTEEPRRYQSPVRQNEYVGTYRAPRSPIRETYAKPEEEIKKKSFMPAFIKPHHVQQQFFDRQNSNSSTSTGYQNQPQYQARSGFPGQNLSNVPSPVDRVNSARNIHLKRHTSENYRRESPGRYSPNRSSPNHMENRSPTNSTSNNRNHQSPIRSNGSSQNNGHYSPSRNSPHRASPISPLAEPENAPPKKMTIEDSVQLAEDCSLRYINGDDRALGIFTSSKLPRKALTTVCEYILEKSSLKKTNNEKWKKIIDTWTNADVMQEALANWIGEKSEIGSNAPVIIAYCISKTLVDKSSLESMLRKGKHYPAFFMILRELNDLMGILYIQRNFGDVDLLAMMTERDRTKLRLLLAEYKLLFLIPKYREEQYLYEERDLTPTEIYRSMKGRGEPGSSAGAAINLIWEKQLDGVKVKSLLVKVLTGKPILQKTALKAVVLAHHERGFEKGALVKQFEYIYDNDLIEEDGFIAWENDVHDQCPGRNQALLQVSPWLRWLKEADVETDDEKENQKNEEIKDNGEVITENMAQLEVTA